MILVNVSTRREPINHSLGSYASKVCVTVDGSPLCAFDSRNHGGESGARREAEHYARIALDAIRLAGVTATGTSHGYNL